MARIDEMTFAKLVSGGKVCRTTCLVYRDKVDSRWWRETGSLYSPGDFDDVLELKPEIIILGLGLLNKVTVLPETLERFKDAGIPFEVMDSKAAMDRFNTLFDEGKSVVGAFHLL